MRNRARTPSTPYTTGSSDAAARSPKNLATLAVLALLALIGVASLLTSDLGLASLAKQAGMTEDRLRLIVLIQPAILVLIATVIGWRTSRRTDFATPILDGGRSAVRRDALVAAGILAVLAGAALTVYGYLTTSVFPLGDADSLSTSVATRLLYGGITEEVLLRWGLMGLFAWLLLRFVPDAGSKRGRWIWIANLAAAVLFAVGHFPALAIISGATAVHYALSFVVNVAAGLGFGWLFSRFGLEYAFVAHAGTHVVALVAAAALL